MPAKRKSAPKINPELAWYALEVRGSHIHGWGVFALEDIPGKKPVIEYSGKRLTSGQAACVRPPKDEYLARLDLNTVLDGAFHGSGAERINHSCAPNLVVKKTRTRIVFHSLRRIRAGEELTFRYSYPVKIKRIPCRCGSQNCRRTLRYIFRW